MLDFKSCRAAPLECRGPPPRAPFVLLLLAALRRFSPASRPRRSALLDSRALAAPCGSVSASRNMRGGRSNGAAAREEGKGGVGGAARRVARTRARTRAKNYRPFSGGEKEGDF
jgi:hypothetical protein